jgi:hypothetical protein
MKSIVILLTLTLLASVAMAEVTYSGGDGSSFKKAVVVIGAKNLDEVIAAERLWIDKHNPACRIGQSQQNSYYHVVSITTQEGLVKIVYFDVTHIDSFKMKVIEMPHSDELSYSGGDGSSPQEAVQVPGVNDVGGLVSAQYYWLNKHYPKFELEKTSTQDADKKLYYDSSGKPYHPGNVYQVLSIKTQEGEHKDVYFDATRFFVH